MIHDENGTPLTSTRDIPRVFADHFRDKYDTIDVRGDCMKRIVECNMPALPDAANLALEEPITLEEIHHSIETGKLHKALGYDGICLEFLKITWETIKHDQLQIVNEMYNAELITDQQK
jgi:hypothetical protein